MYGRARISGPLTAAFVLAVLGGFAAENAAALEVETVVWGFDGKVVPNQFNPLSILMFNPEPDPFEGIIELQKSLPDGPKGATLLEPVYVSPFTRRWVQFYPYVQREWESWSLAWKPGRGRFNFPTQPTHSSPAHVLLNTPGSLTRGGGNLRTFNEELFPPVVSATGALASVAIDHQPRWQKAREQAFIDWLRAGGRVHLLHDGSGEFPEFTGLLSELNTPVDRFRVGAGIVHRHPRRRTQLDRAFVQQEIRRAGLSGQTGQAQAEDDDQSPAGETANYDQWGNSLEIDFSGLNQQFFRELKGLTRPEHNWAVIHLMSILYILVVFPGCWLLGRGRRDYRLTLGALLGAIVLFSLGFRWVGRRGYGEATAAHSVAIVRPLAEGEYLVSMWSNVFVTDGDDYLITHDGTGRIYSTAQETERVNGAIQNGLNGRFLVDIPPFSSREFVARFKVNDQPIQPKVTQWQTDGENLRLSITVGPNFPSASAQMYALYRDAFYHVNRQGDRVTLGSRISKAPQFLQYSNQGVFRSYGPWYDDERPPEQVFAGMIEPLIGRELGLNRREDLDRVSLPDDRVRLYVFAPLPDSLRTRRLVEDEKRDFARLQDGRALYCFDLFAPEQL